MFDFFFKKPKRTGYALPDRHDVNGTLEFIRNNDPAGKYLVFFLTIISEADPTETDFIAMMGKALTESNAGTGNNVVEKLDLSIFNHSLEQDRATDLRPLLQWIELSSSLCEVFINCSLELHSQFLPSLSRSSTIRQLTILSVGHHASRLEPLCAIDVYTGFVNNTALRHLYLSDVCCDTSPGLFPVVLRAVGTMTALTRLDVSTRPQDVDLFHEFSKMLKQTQSLQHLGLFGDGDFTPVNIDSLMPGVQANQSLKTLELLDFSMDTVSFVLLQQALAENGVQDLILRECSWSFQLSPTPKPFGCANVVANAQ